MVNDLSNDGDLACVRTSLEEDNWKHAVVVSLLERQLRGHLARRTPSNLDEALEV